MFRMIFHAFLRLFVYVLIGTNVYGKENLPTNGPAIIAANHNSHLDAVVLLSLFRVGQARQVHIAAAADYFFKSPLAGKLFSGFMGLIPLSRHIEHKKGSGILDGIYEALDAGGIVIIFPEGTRGNPGELSPLKNGISKVAEHRQDTPVIPVFLHGTDKSLPKGKKSFVPLIVNVTVGEGIAYPGSRTDFMKMLSDAFAALDTKTYV